MDCASCTSSVSQAQQSALQQQIQIAVAAKQLSSQRQQGEAVAALLDAAVQLSKEAGKGGAVDVQG
jgi:hypothetical protein